jgi:hypothetical protein
VWPQVTDAGLRWAHINGVAAQSACGSTDTDVS